MHCTKRTFLLFSLISYLWCQQSSPTLADPVPANDGVGTSVVIDDNYFNIVGGQLSGDQANLFHSFEQFGLTQEQVANFLSNPQIRNILVRVSGGDASVINGLLQVSGGSSNLLFMNPSGIIFGPDATLNLPADFVATTADRLHFGDDWFSAFGDNSYSTLLGDPTELTFSAETPGAILNFADLQVQYGSQLSLLGGTIVSSGSLSAPGGDLIVTTVPGKHAIRLSQPGSLLQLEIELPSDVAELTNWAFSVISLPELLTTDIIEEESPLYTRQSGQLAISNSNFDFDSGDALIQTATAGTIEINTVGNLTAIGGIFRTDGDLQLAANQNLQLRDNAVNPLVLEAWLTDKSC